MIITNGHKPKQLGEAIDGDTEIVRFDGVSTATVYYGGLSYLDRACLEWRKEEITAPDDEASEVPVDEWELLTLNEIVEQSKANKDTATNLITVIIENPRSGEIWQYGNYHDGKWYRIGNVYGYA